MKIKFKKKINENTYMKLSIKIDDYTLHDKLTKEEVENIIGLTFECVSPKPQIIDLSEKGLVGCEPERKKKC